MASKFSMDDYVDVAERVQDFKDTFRDGSLQTIDWEIVTVAHPDGPKTFVVYRAAAYRTPDDERPGHGIAWEPFPGETNYTRNSELMNAETAAWGRAIIALGLTANRKLASRQEVRARVEEAEARSAKPTDPHAEQQATPTTEAPKRARKPPVVKPTAAEVEELRELMKAAKWELSTMALQLVAVDALDATGMAFDNAAPLSPEATEELKQRVGRAVVALKPEAYATVKRALEDEVERRAASDAA